MANNKWVEVEARSIDDAIKAGLNELNLEDATQANINILREPEGGAVSYTHLTLPTSDLV